MVVINSCTDSATYFGVKSRAWLRELHQLRNMQFLHLSPAIRGGKRSSPAAALGARGTRAGGDPRDRAEPPALPNTAHPCRAGCSEGHGAGNAVPRVRVQKGAELPPQIPRPTPKHPWDIPGRLQGSAGPRGRAVNLSQTTPKCLSLKAALETSAFPFLDHQCPKLIHPPTEPRWAWNIPSFQLRTLSF